MNGDYLDYLAHYRTPGTPNGVSHTPGYDAVGKPAMSEAEKRAKRKADKRAYRSEIKGAKNYQSSTKYNEYHRDSRWLGKKNANRINYIQDKYGRDAALAYRKKVKARRIGTAATLGALAQIGATTTMVIANNKNAETNRMIDGLIKSYMQDSFIQLNKINL